MARLSPVRRFITSHPIATVGDERFGSARVQARHWRVMALAATALAGGLAVGLLY